MKNILSKSAFLLQFFALASYTIAHETDKKPLRTNYPSYSENILFDAITKSTSSTVYAKCPDEPSRFMIVQRYARHDFHCADLVLESIVAICFFHTQAGIGVAMPATA